MPQIKILVPSKQEISLTNFDKSLLSSNEQTTLPMKKAISFLEALSKSISTDATHSRDPELASLAFWLRKKNITRLVQKHFTKNDINQEYSSKGIIFLIPPTNVGTLFCYHAALSLLSGNKTIIRLSSKASILSICLCNIINNILERTEFEPISQNLTILSYKHSAEITKFFSLRCDARIVWGTDKTVQEIRRIPLAANAIDISFSNKFSWVAIDAKSFLSTTDLSLSRFIDTFFSDLTLFDQKACTSPKILVWIGHEELTKKASEKLSKLLLEKHVTTVPHLLLGNTVEKAETLYALMACMSKSQLVFNHQFLSYLKVTSPTLEDLDKIRQFHRGNRILLEISLPKLSAIHKLTTKTDQTLSYYGFNKTDLAEFIRKRNKFSFDRIVPIGRTHSFSEYWDGYNLFSLFRNEITLISTSE